MNFLADSHLLISSAPIEMSDVIYVDMASITYFGFFQR
jgi:hypothetical protein